MKNISCPRKWNKFEQNKMWKSCRLIKKIHKYFLYYNQLNTLEWIEKNRSNYNILWKLLRWKLFINFVKEPFFLIITHDSLSNQKYFSSFYKIIYPKNYTLFRRDTFLIFFLHLHRTTDWYQEITFQNYILVYTLESFSSE